MNHYMTRIMANRMFALMKDKGVSTNNICKILNVEYPDFIAAVDGKHPFYNKWQRKIAEALGIEREVLFHEFCFDSSNLRSRNRLIKNDESTAQN